jgi:hypothetical protein
MLPNGTSFPYNGGPANPVPQIVPAPPPNPTRQPAGTVPLDGKLVSVPAKKPAEKFAYPAYGDGKKTERNVKDQVAEKNNR